MTESQTQEPPGGVTTWDETKARAVAALDDARRAGFDMGEFICHAVTAAAANAGGAEALLSVRSGSWEADYVRQIVQSTAGDELPDLLRHRTEPVRVYLPVGYIAEELGLRDLADDENGPAEKAAWRLWDQIPAEVWEPDPDKHIEDLPEGFTQPNRVRSDITPDQRAALDAANLANEAASAENERIEAMYQADLVAYAAALRAAVAEIVAEHGLPAEAFEVVDDHRPDAESMSAYSELWGVVDAIEFGEAQARAVVPVLGRAPRDIEGTVPDALRAAGLSYVQRLAAEQEDDR